MAQQMTDNFWQAEARSEETKKFIKDIKRLTRCKFTAEEKIRIFLEGFRRDTPIRDLCHREGISKSSREGRRLKALTEQLRLRDQVLSEVDLLELLNVEQPTLDKLRRDKFPFIRLNAKCRVYLANEVLDWLKKHPTGI